MDKKFIQKLERKVLKTTMRRYKRWKKENGEVKPFGHQYAIEKRDSWAMVKACEELDKAKTNGVGARD